MALSEVNMIKYTNIRSFESEKAYLNECLKNKTRIYLRFLERDLAQKKKSITNSLMEELKHT